MRNIIIDAAIGLMPIGGDIFDGFFKCNTMNYKLLMETMKERSDTRAGLANGVPIRINNQSQPSRIMNEKHAHDDPPRYAAAQGGATAGIPAYPARPQPAKLGKKSYGDVFVEKYNTWRGGDRDLERGDAPPPQPPRH